MIQLPRSAALVLFLALVGSPASAMDTKAAGKCVALGALDKNHQAKAEAILDAANRTGYGALVNQRVKEEFAFLAANKGNKAMTNGWILQAVSACRQF